MVDRISRLGYQSWFIQRMTALLSGIYGVFIVVFLWVYHPISYLQWHALFDHWLVKIMTLIVIFNVLLHAWIGLWTIFTDYVKNKFMRLVFQTVICLLLIAYFIWAIEFFWIAC
ncbi:succinate dehydrogenase, hydrophobic membrane anchor protein [Coxiella endosymbiont of Amblyomma nuttalli]|uniref:succinate dehydrogenase, hydrophobic membrane anchor protein n=1 Tax=Coxiella endosymbiont of Amblyomma nuttalli TaxID=2749996 RepID=UPI001BB4E904|nr:succinate dehydrogenase, hydrophobic membrane anchor protein [Coxiella endosymbiont of Amblyomma nuttalli]QTS83691.1 Succinate dehydrogenase hydrophobic membrane anchor subunit [Coxiella endosymbiont of Amblyomma nuttalli]